MTKITVCAVLLPMLVCVSALAEEWEDTIALAESAIRKQQFDEIDCPKVVKATRFDDGSIKAYCTNGADFRVLVGGFVLRCVSARAMGFVGC